MWLCNLGVKACSSKEKMKGGRKEFIGEGSCKFRIYSAKMSYTIMQSIASVNSL